MCLLLAHRPEEMPAAFEGLREGLKLTSYTCTGLLERMWDVGGTTFGLAMH